MKTLFEGSTGTLITTQQAPVADRRGEMKAKPLEFQLVCVCLSNFVLIIVARHIVTVSRFYIEEPCPGSAQASGINWE
jgi:hypothetical protein